MSKTAIFIIFLTIVFAGCNSSQLAELNTEEESEAIYEKEISYVGKSDIEEGVMHTYSFNYPSGKDLVEGNVYIFQFKDSLTSSEKEVCADKHATDSHDYSVIDYRIGWDPDLQVRNSYKANSESERICIINILLDYEQRDPTDWERSFNSMKNEWYWHNAAYLAGYNVERVKDVDLNNKDEKSYPTLNPFKNE